MSGENISDFSCCSFADFDSKLLCSNVFISHVSVLGTHEFPELFDKVAKICDLLKCNKNSQ